MTFRIVGDSAEPVYIVGAGGPLVVSGTLTATPADSTAAGSITANGQSVALTLGAGQSNWILQIAGTYTGTLTTEGTVDGTNWVPFNYRQTGNGAIANTITSRTGIFRGNGAGLTQIRVRATAWTSGTATITMRGSPGVGPVFQNAFVVSQTIEQYYASTAGGNVAFNATSGTVAVTNNQTGNIALLRNPSGSSVDLYLAKITIGASGAGTFQRFRGGTLGSLGSATASVNRGGGSNTATGLFYAGAAIVISAGGTSGKTNFLGAGGSDPDMVNGGIILRPGQHIYWSFTNTSGQSNNASVEVVWWEAGQLT